MLKSALHTSIVITLLFKLFEAYCRIERFLIAAYTNSRVYLLRRTICAGITASITHCFLGRLCAILSKLDKTAFLKNSNFIAKLTHIYQLFHLWFFHSIAASRTVRLLKRANTEPQALSIRLTSCLLVMTVTANIFFVIIFKQAVSLWGVIMRGVILLIGFCGVFSSARWQDAKETSIFLKNTAY